MTSNYVVPEEFSDMEEWEDMSRAMVDLSWVDPARSPLPPPSQGGIQEGRDEENPGPLSQVGGGYYG